VDLEKSFTFQFEDRDWLTKLGLGALISLVPILNFAWTGYMVGIIRNVRDGVTPTLPTWDDLDRKFIDGLILFAASLIYALPVLLLLGVPFFIALSAGLLSTDGNMQDLSQVIASVGGALFFVAICGILLYSLLLSVVYPAIQVIFAREGTFASCFKFGEVMNLINRNLGAYFTAWGISIVGAILVGMVASIVTAMIGWIPCIGWIITLVLTFAPGVYLASVYSHLFGQFGRLAAANS
jgi:hypothetical protein